MTLSTTLATLAGLVQVLSVWVVSYPEHYKNTTKKDIHPLLHNLIVPLNIMAQAFAGLCNTASAFYGPVSCVVPIAIASQLVWNIIVFDCFTGMEKFDKPARVGAIIIAIGAFMIPIVGPKPQNQNVIELFESGSAILWSVFLLAVVLISLYINIFFVSAKKIDGYTAFTSLLAARVSSAVVCTSCSSSFASLVGFDLALPLFLFILCTFVMGHSTYLQAVVNQKTFVPAVACTTQIVNSLTGLIIWRDNLTIQSWSGYLAMMFQFLLGVYLTINIDIVQDASDPEYPFNPSMLIKKVFNIVQQKRNVRFSDVIESYGMNESPLHSDASLTRATEESSCLVEKSSKNESYESTLFEV